MWTCALLDLSGYVISRHKSYGAAYAALEKGLAKGWRGLKVAPRDEIEEWQL